MRVPESRSLFSTEFDTVVEQALQTFHIPGSSIAIVRGEEVHTKAYGFAELPSTPAAPETLYFIGSLTKSFLGATIAKFIASKDNQQRGKHDQISLTTSIRSIVGEDFVLPDLWATERITLEDTLSHRTGSSRHDTAYGGSIATPQAVTRNLRFLPLNNEPRAIFEYCNSMYAAATHALETAAGKSFDALLREYITGPLHMHDTHTTRHEALKKAHGATRLHHGYGWEGDWKGTEGRHTDHVYGSPDGLPAIGGAGCIISNVHDMAKYVQALLGVRSSGAEEGRGLDKSIREEMMKPRIRMAKNDFDDGYMHYCLGLWRYHYRGVEIVQHSGDAVGYSTFLAIIPTRNWGFVFLGNGDWASAAAAKMFYYLIDEMLMVPSLERYDPTEMNLEIIRKLTYKDPDLARKLFPQAPRPSLPLARPLSEYTGVFWNDGYREISIRLIDRRQNGREAYLEGRADDTNNVVILQMVHVSGEVWAGYKLRGAVEVLGQGIQEFKALTRIGVDGTVQAWGVEMESELRRNNWTDKLIWFERVAY